jgi:hypothetical protein
LVAAANAFGATLHVAMSGDDAAETGNGDLNNQGTHQLDMARWALDDGLNQSLLGDSGLRDALNQCAET